MKKIADLLEKFDNLQSPGQKKDKLIKIIEEKTGILLKRSELDLNNKTLFIKASGLAKNEIFFHQKELLDAFNNLKNLRIDKIL